MPSGVYGERRKSIPGDPLTLRQEQVLAFVTGYLRENRFPPTNRDIIEHFGFVGTNSAMGFLRALRAKGRLRWEGLQARTIVLLDESGRRLCCWCQGAIASEELPPAQAPDGRLPMSPPQRAMFDFLREFTFRNGFPPSMRDSLDAQGVTIGSIVIRTNYLARDGYITHRPRVSRGTVILPAPGSTDCPVCRRPLPAQTGPG